jgi:hypothetical protein
MGKGDRIFYAACGISALDLLLDYEMALLFFVAACLLRPVLHEFGLAQQHSDECQLTTHSRSGNIAFIIFILVAAAPAL